MPSRPGEAACRGDGAWQVLAALDQVEELVPAENGAAETALRALVDKYNTVRPFLKLLGESQALPAAGGCKVLAAVRRLPELARRQVSLRCLGSSGRHPQVGLGMS